MGDSAPNPLGTPFPAPPSFYQTFTSDNLSRLAELEKQAEAEGTKLETSLPPELQCLRPPTPPANGTYRSFGEERSLDAPLSTLPPDTRTLPPPPAGEPDKGKPPAASPAGLLNLTRSLTMGYVELMMILNRNPDATEYGPKWDDLRDLFQNAHAMINAYRGWQGREALIALLEGKVKRGRESVKEWETMEGRVNEVLATVEEGEKKAEVESQELKKATNGRKRKREEEHEVWDLLDEDL